MKVELKANQVRQLVAYTEYSTKWGMTNLQFCKKLPLPTSHMTEQQVDAHILDLIFVPKYSHKKGLEFSNKKGSVVNQRELYTKTKTSGRIDHFLH